MENKLLEPNFNEKLFEIKITVSKNSHIIETNSIKENYHPSYAEIIGALEINKLAMCNAQSNYNRKQSYKQMLNNIKKLKSKHMKKTEKHPGFAGVQKQVAKREHVSMASAGAIIAQAARNASAAAKKANPKLKKVKGKTKRKK